MSNCIGERRFVVVKSSNHEAVMGSGFIDTYGAA